MGEEGPAQTNAGQPQTPKSTSVGQLVGQDHVNLKRTLQGELNELIKSRGYHVCEKIDRLITGILEQLGPNRKP